MLLNYRTNKQEQTKQEIIYVCLGYFQTVLQSCHAVPELDREHAVVPVGQNVHRSLWAEMDCPISISFYSTAFSNFEFSQPSYSGCLELIWLGAIVTNDSWFSMTISEMQGTDFPYSEKSFF